MAIDKDAPDFVTALARGLSVIRCFGKDAVNLKLSEVAERTALTRPTARRFLLTLEAIGYIGTDGKRFWLMPRTLDLGYSYLSSIGIGVTAQASMRAVVETLNESCSMGVLDNGDVIYIARAAPKHMMSLQINVGSRLPAFCNSIGRVLLAGLNTADLAAFFKTGVRPSFTRYTLTDERRLRRVLAEVREAGYALIDQEVELGLRAIAVPIRTASGRVVAGLSVGAHTGRVSKGAMVKTVLPALRQRAQEIEAILLHSDHPGWIGTTEPARGKR